MNVAIASGSPAVSRLAEQREAPGPDVVNDHDGDDGAAAAKAPPPPAGMGTIVDKTA